MPSLARTSILSGIALAARVATGLAISKILAVYVGPSGYGLIGQMQGLTSILGGLTGGAFSNGVTKGTAEHFDDENRQRAIWRTAARLSLWTTAGAVVLLLVLKEPLGHWLFGRDDLSGALYWLAVALPALSANALLLAIVNGRKDVRGYVTVGVLGSGLSLAATAGLVAAFGLPGALAAVAIGPAVSVFAAAALASRRHWFRFGYLWGGVDSQPARQLAGFALMAITTAVCAPGAQMLIRDHLAADFGWSSAGHWHALNKVSEVYLSVITTTLAVYFLPRIAEIRQVPELWQEIAKVLRFAVPLAALGAGVIYAGREIVVLWLFTEEFAPMAQLFAWQLAGDVLRVASWVFAYVLVGRAATTAFIGAELVFSTTWVLLTWTLTAPFGLKGAVIAYFLNCAMYLAATAGLVRQLLAKQASR